MTVRARDDNDRRSSRRSLSQWRLAHRVGVRRSITGSGSRAASLGGHGAKLIVAVFHADHELNATWSCIEANTVSVTLKLVTSFAVVK